MVCIFNTLEEGVVVWAFVLVRLVFYCNDTFPIYVFSWLTLEPMTLSACIPGVTLVGSVLARGALGSIWYIMSNCEYIKSICFSLRMNSSFDCSPIIVTYLHISGHKDFRNQLAKNCLGISSLIIYILHLNSWRLVEMWVAPFCKKDVYNSMSVS